jgi:hypothetical protein
VLVELIDVEVADFKHARHEHASRKTSGGIHELPAGEGLESGWRGLERSWREAGGRLGRGYFLSLLSRPAAAASPLWPCCCCFSSLYAPPPGIGSELLSTCM